MERTTIMLADDVDARLTLDLPLGMVDTRAFTPVP
jgi:hypothetical protein